MKLRWKYSVLNVLLLALLMRAGSLTILMIDPDEWSYIISAKEWLQGKLLYRDILDIKPPGIFIIFSAFIAFFGKWWVVYRLLTSLLLGFSAWACGKIALNIWKRPGVEWPAALFFLSAFMYPMAMAMNTELFYVSLAVLSVYGVIKGGKWNVLAGASMGVAMLVKYTLPAEMLLLVFFLFRGFKKVSLSQAIAPVLWFTAGFAVVVGGSFIWLFLSGSLDFFLQMMKQIPSSYAKAGSMKARLDLFALFHFRFSWLAISAYAGWWIMRKHRHPIAMYFALLWLFVWVSVLASGRLHDHYWLQLAPFYALVAAGSFPEVHFRKLRGLFSILLIVLPNFWVLSTFNKQNRELQEKASKIASYMNDDMVVWCAGMPAVYYHLLQSPCPTPYVHGSLLTNPTHIQSFQIDVPKEWQSAMDKSDAILLNRQSTNRSQEILELASKDFPNVIQIDSETILLMRAE